MNKQWRVAKRLDDDLWEHLLLSRGLTSDADRQRFFSPTLDQLSSPNDWPDMDQAVGRIMEAIRQKQPMVVWGDFDADGVTSTAIIWETLYDLGAQVMPYIPNRDNEGHGFNQAGLEKLAADGTKLIITVDHGVTAFEDIAAAQQLGMEVIVTDHHEPHRVEGPKNPGAQESNQSSYEFPECVAVIHPFRLATQEKLAGCGTAYFLAYATWLASQGTQASKDPKIQSVFDGDTIETREEFASKYIELAALGTIADMMPLTDMNRVFASMGLKSLASTDRIGLKQLYKVSALEPKDSLSVYEVGFLVAPRLNAPGRLAEALDSLRLLCSKDASRSRQLADELNSLNTQRQELLLQVTEAAGKELQRHSHVDAYVLKHADWPAGVCGLAAGKLVERVYRPVVVMQEMGEVCRGSARSIKGFDITAALTEISDLLDGFGGHAMAAGFSCQTKDVDEIEARLSAMVTDQLSAEQLQPTLAIDAEVKLEELTALFFEQLRLLEPCGMGNSQPAFVGCGLEVAAVKVMGKQQNHLKLLLNESGTSFEAVAFNFGQLANKLSQSKVDIAFTLDENIWNGKTTLQLKVKDIHVV